MSRGGGRTGATRDHIFPKSKGGALRDFGNAVVCRRCNNDKGDMTIVEFYALLQVRGDPRAQHVSRFILKLRTTAPLFLVDRLLGTAVDNPV